MKITGHCLELRSDRNLQEGGLGIPINRNRIYQAGARMYDPETGQFYGVDAANFKYPHLSSYVYVANNPIRFIDPDGNEIDVSELFKGCEEKGGCENPQQVAAFIQYIMTEEGRAEIAKYAKSGDAIP